MSFSRRSLRPQMLEIAGRRVRVWRAGPPEGRDLVLLHGAGCDNARVSWGRLARPLASMFRVTAIDFPGYGGSDPLPGRYCVADLSVWLTQVLDALDIRRAHVAGVSMGGAVALRQALDQPDRVRSVAAIATFGLTDRLPRLHTLGWIAARLPTTALTWRVMYASRKAAVTSLRTLYSDPTRIDDRLLEEIATATGTPTAAASFDAFQAGEVGLRRLTTHLTPDLHRLKVPTLFLHGTGDLLIPIEAATRAAALAPGSQLITLRAGHWPHRERPGATRAALLEFFGQPI